MERIICRRDNGCNEKPRLDSVTGIVRYSSEQQFIKCFDCKHPGMKFNETIEAGKVIKSQNFGD